jgi:hypothetical protein
MPGTMSDSERKKKMEDFDWANKNPVEALRRQREKEATDKERISDKQAGLQLPWSQRRKDEAK